MAEKENGKGPIVTSKSFMAVGPTLHYSHSNVQACWFLSLAVFVVTCLFFSKILSGSFLSFTLESATQPEQWRLGRYLTAGVSIFEYPWQILVLALLMGILSIAPILTAQLLSFGYSFPFIVAVFFFANLPAFAVCLLVSCIAVACRPLRFRSRFIAIALCTVPQILYWGYFGSIRGVEPVKLGFSFVPWTAAWLIGLGIAGGVIGVGHFTRYRPGLVWSSTAFVLAAAAVLFKLEIGFDELDYQLYVARNNPEQVTEFHDHSITDAIDRTITNPAVIKYLGDFFYPAEPIPLRKELKKEIQAQLAHNRWPGWFIVPDQLKFQEKGKWLFDRYDLFITRRPTSNRMPIALYYKALLSEYSPDYNMLEQKEILHFYSDYPFERSRKIWYQLYREFGDSPESLEARWRIAMHWAGQGRFEEADALLVEARERLDEQVDLLAKDQTRGETLFSPFRPPAESVVTMFKLTELQRKLNQLRTLISGENRTDKPESAGRLAKFVVLSPHSPDYGQRLAELLAQMGRNDPLRDNVLLAQTKVIADEQLRAEKLAELHKKFGDTDAGMQSLYELGLLKIRFWRQQDESNAENKKQLLADARATLTSFLSLYPDSFCAEQVKKNLADLPTVE